jgi:hypothetical protein
VFVRAAHDPPKCERFGDKIMRFLKQMRARSGAKPASTFADRALACAAPLRVGPSQVSQVNRDWLICS